MGKFYILFHLFDTIALVWFPPYIGTTIAEGIAEIWFITENNRVLLIKRPTLMFSRSDWTLFFLLKNYHWLRNRYTSLELGVHKIEKEQRQHPSNLWQFHNRFEIRILFTWRPSWPLNRSWIDLNELSSYFQDSSLRVSHLDNWSHTSFPQCMNDDIHP